MLPGGHHAWCAEAGLPGSVSIGALPSASPRRRPCALRAVLRAMSRLKLMLKLAEVDGLTGNLPRDRAAIAAIEQQPQFDEMALSYRSAPLVIIDFRA